MEAREAIGQHTSSLETDEGYERGRRDENYCPN